MSAMDCLRSPWQAAKMTVKAYSPDLWKEVRTVANSIEDEYTQKQFLLIVYIYAAFSEMYCTDDVEAERKAAPFIQKLFRLRDAAMKARSDLN